MELYSKNKHRLLRAYLHTFAVANLYWSVKKFYLEVRKRPLSRSFFRLEIIKNKLRISMYFLLNCIFLLFLQLCTETLSIT